MTHDVAEVPGADTLSREQRQRWAELVDRVAALLPRTASVVVSGDQRTEPIARHLADRLRAAARDVRTADGPAPYGERDVVIRLRTRARTDTEARSDISIDVHDPSWPVIRHVVPELAGPDAWYVAESRAFFAPRAATWDTKFGDDMPAYAAAVAESRIPPGAAAADIGCGTGRALPALRDAVGPSGAVIGLDITPQMLAAARDAGRARHAALLLADARNPPFADASLDAVFAAGLITHLPDPATGLAELARITRPGGRLTLFHPSGRAALARRHGRPLRPDDPLAEPRLTALMARTGWRLDTYDDPPHRFLAIATRRDAALTPGG
ncbi:MAG TPA: class I SAM-dependent methyltransferase [Streptosporangiaceae bacterium]